MLFILTLLLSIGILYALTLFLQTASPHQTGRLLGFVAIILGVVSLFYLALTGRLPWALGILIAAWPVLAAHFNRRRAKVLNQHLTLNDQDGSLKERVKNDFEENS